MNKMHVKLIRWYRNRNTRERTFVILLCCAFLYAIFYFTLFRSLDQKSDVIASEIHDEKNKLASWQNQLEALKRISQSDLYKTWEKQQDTLKKLRDEYKNFIVPPTSTYWQDVIKTVLSTQTNLKTDEVKYYPATVFSTLMLPGRTAKIWSQKVSVTVYGNYFDTIAYLKALEKDIPIAQWDRLSYQVTQYPQAKVTLEFSILYEQNN